MSTTHFKYDVYFLVNSKTWKSVDKLRLRENTLRWIWTAYQIGSLNVVLFLTVLLGGLLQDGAHKFRGPRWRGRGLVWRGCRPPHGYLAGGPPSGSCPAGQQHPGQRHRYRSSLCFIICIRYRRVPYRTKEFEILHEVPFPTHWISGLISPCWALVIKVEAWSKM